MSPTVPAVGSPRASMTRISPGLTCSTARFWAFSPVRPTVVPYWANRSSRNGT